MSIYQCENCGCVENTALGHYHCRNMKNMFLNEEKYLNKKLCSSCGPKFYKDGKPTEYGKWHNRFDRHFYPKGKLYTDHNGNVRDIDTKEYPDNDLYRDIPYEEQNQEEV